VNVAAGDLGASAAKKYDIEAGSRPGAYRELTSTSNTTDLPGSPLGIRTARRQRSSRCTR
jgi:seryl-tRNA synthetase